MSIDPYVQQLLAAERSGQSLGLKVTSASGGQATAELVVSAEMANGHGVAQGGYTFTLADQAFACAANSLLPGAATAEASITYLAPAEVGATLVAEASTFFVDDRRMVVDVIVRADGREIALFRGTGRVMRPRV
ncbi:PaaI family thioesterase [Leucobacter tenebrionis]|uniref:PaaI family thioesterase n=1 Tax=Leucobacter tenebrionis TaxID=2873270 RepID=UPI001CA679BA|nr:hotdog fold thioesterase [Leucobacter tenebrionis]QZY50637.1 hotdog fold thioesterase [Leucobacter tenebrionis]